MKGRSQHYAFAHQHLRELVARAPDQLRAGLSHDADSYLKSLWSGLGSQPCEGLSGRIVERDGVVVGLVVMPPPQKCPEALFVAVVFDGPVPATPRAVDGAKLPRYFTLELGQAFAGRRDHMLCEWDPRMAHGPAEFSDVEGFVRWVISEVREPSKVAMTMDLTDLNITKLDLYVFLGAETKEPVSMTLLKAAAVYGVLIGHASQPLMTQLYGVCNLRWWSPRLRRAARETLSTLAFAMFVDEFQKVHAGMGPQAAAAAAMIVNMRFPRRRNLLQAAVAGSPQEIDVGTFPSLVLKAAQRDETPERIAGVARLFGMQQDLLERAFASLNLEGIEPPVGDEQV